MLNLGNIVFGLEATTKGLDAALRNVQNFGNRVTDAVKTQKGGIDAATRALIRQESAMVKGLQNVQNLTSRINRTKIAPEVKTDMIDKLNQSYEAFARRMNTRTDRPLNILAFQRASLGFKESVDQVIRSLNVEQQALKSAGAAGADAFQKQTIAIMKAEFQVEQLIAKLNKLQSTGGLSKDASANLAGIAQGALSQYKSALNTATPLNAVEMQRATLGLQRGLSQVREEITSTRKATDPLIAAFRGIGSAIELSAGPLNGFVFRIRAASELMGRYGVLIGGIVSGLVGLGVAFTSVGGSIIRTNMELERTTVMLNAVSGSSIQTAADMAFIRDISDRTGLSFQATAKDYARFSASAIAAGQSIETVHKQFTQIAYGIGTLQLSVDDARGVFRALEQIMSKGTVQSEELRGQLADRFPAAFTIGAKAIGVTTAELGKMMKQGEVISRDFVPAFLQAMTEFYNIDISKPIDTLNAEINRLGNSWTFFQKALGEAINSQGIAKNVLQGLGSVLNYLTANINQLIGAAGALAGAFVGLTIAMALPAIFAAVGQFAAFLSLLVQVRSAVQLLTLAQATLNITMLANPLIGLLSLLARLGIVIGGAVVGYNLLTNAVQVNQAAMGDLSGIEGYIAAQKALGSQVSATTEMLIKQQQALLATAKANLAESAEKATKAVGRSKWWQDFTGNNEFKGGLIGNWLSDNAEKAKAANQDYAAEVKRREQLVNQLQELLKLPETADSPNALGGGAGGGGAGKMARDGLARLRDLIAGAEEASEKMAILAKGPQDVKLIDDLFTARDALRELNATQLGNLDGMLKAAGYTSGTLEERLTAIVTKTRVATESVRQFAQIWEDLRGGANELEHINRQLDHLASGKDPSKLFMLDAIVDAKNALRDMSEEGLQAVRMALDDMGIKAATAEEGLIKFYQTVDKAAQELEAAKTVFGDFWDNSLLVENQLDKLAKISQGTSLEGLLDLDYLQQADEALRYLSQDAYQQLGEALKAAGYAGDDTAQRWASMLKTIDRNAEAIDLVTERLKANRDAWIEWSTGVIDDIKGVLTGATSFEEGMRNIFKRLADTILDVALFEPLKNSLRDSITALSESRTSGYGTNDAIGASTIFSGIGSVLSNIFTPNGNNKDSSTKAMEDLTSSTTRASQALGTDLAAATGKSVLQMLTQGTASAANAIGLNSATSALFTFTTAVYNAASALSVGGGGEGGFFGKVLGIGASLFSGGLSSAAGFATTANGVMDLTNWVPGRASGGPMTRGRPYVINEPNSRGDLFIPGSSGRAVPISELTSQQRSVTIDASIGFIDARGATPDAVEALKQEMRAREERLRRELPYLVDSRYIDSSARGRYQ